MKKKPATFIMHPVGTYDEDPNLGHGYVFVKTRDFHKWLTKTFVEVEPVTKPSQLKGKR